VTEADRVHCMIGDNVSLASPLTRRHAVDDRYRCRWRSGTRANHLLLPLRAVRRRSVLPCLLLLLLLLLLQTWSMLKRNNQT